MTSCVVGCIVSRRRPSDNVLVSRSTCVSKDKAIGRFDTLYDVNNRYIGVASARENKTQSEVLQDKYKLSDCSKCNRSGKNMHMTLYLSRNRNTRNRGNPLLKKEKLESALTAHGMELDYGPTVVTRLEVSHRAISLSAPFRHIYDLSIDL
ncbi:hypothetical protein BDC45DRAFT_542394 [Circinella umbellata]|nr:hypothetical protein BDC45DRAFT_542394 [Circinella umbellata]